MDLVSATDSIVFPNLNEADVQCEVPNVCVHLSLDDDEDHDGDDGDNHDDDDDGKDGQEEDDLRHLPHINHLKVKLDHKHTGEKFKNKTR